MDEPHTPRYFPGAMLTKYGQRYVFRFGGELKEGEKIQTRGDDINYPSFRTDDGMEYGVNAKNVITKIDTGDDK